MKRGNGPRRAVYLPIFEGYQRIEPFYQRIYFFKNNNAIFTKKARLESI
jgi:hypothetical protein